MQKYKVIFFNLIIFILLSCNSKINDIENEDNEINAIEYPIFTKFYKIGSDNYFYFEIDNVKYTLIEYKVEGVDISNIYTLLATNAKTWKEHNELRKENNTLFNIRFHSWPELIYMDVLSNGIRYRSEYDILEDKMICEKY